MTPRQRTVLRALRTADTPAHAQAVSRRCAETREYVERALHALAMQGYARQTGQGYTLTRRGAGATMRKER